MKTKTEGLIKVCRACIAQGVHTEISLILCDDLEGWNKEGGLIKAAIVCQVPLKQFCFSAIQMTSDSWRLA